MGNLTIEYVSVKPTYTYNLLPRSITSYLTSQNTEVYKFKSSHILSHNRHVYISVNAIAEFQEKVDNKPDVTELIYKLLESLEESAKQNSLKSAFVRFTGYDGFYVQTGAFKNLPGLNNFSEPMKNLILNRVIPLSDIIVN